MTVFRAGRDQRGFTTITILVAMLVGALFVTGAFAAADGDLPLGRKSQHSKQAYAAAEAGINYYAFHMAQDNDYWARCTNVPPPNAGEPSPVANMWYGTGTDTRQNHWRTLPTTNAQYAIELLSPETPTAGNPTPQCVEGDESTMIDATTGMFRIRATGRDGSETRSIVASFRRGSFLDYLWFTNYETQDPTVYKDATDQAWAAANCVDYRAGRDNNCTEIQFASTDRLLGPFHSNDTIWTCNGSTFGRAGKNDTLEVHGPAPGWDNQCGGSAPNFQSTFYPNRPKLDIPTSNSALATVAASGGRVFTGPTRVVLNGNQMQVNGGPAEALPGNGVLYVQNGPGGCSGTVSPLLADYADPPGCGNLYVSGTYSQSLTVASQNDIIISPPPGSGAADLLRVTGSNAVLGLVANGFVRVQHRVTRSDPTDPNSCTNVNSALYPNIGDVEIDAAILSVQHSFMVDNYRCGGSEGDLTIKGALAQNFRGAVGTTGGTGYIKDYNYDDRLKYRSPPYFLEPVAAAWHIVRTNEQVPST
jgi:Tfp pilus assembly protein PilX